MCYCMCPCIYLKNLFVDSECTDIQSKSCSASAIQHHGEKPAKVGDDPNKEKECTEASDLEELIVETELHRSISPNTTDLQKHSLLGISVSDYVHLNHQLLSKPMVFLY